MAKQETSTLYLKRHNKTGKEYLGVTSNDPFKYLGSGVDWKKHIKKHGRYDVTTKILFQDNMNGKHVSDKFKQMSSWWSNVLNVVNDKNFANAKHEDGVLGAKNNVFHRHDNIFDKWEHKLESKGREVAKNKNTAYNKEHIVVKPYNHLVRKLSDEDDLINGFRNYHEETPLEYAKREQRNSITNYVLESVLTPREAIVVKMKFGIGINYDGHTNADISLANNFDTCASNINVIFHKAMRKLRHPTNAVYLKEFLDLE